MKEKTIFLSVRCKMKKIIFLMVFVLPLFFCGPAAEKTSKDQKASDVSNQQKQDMGITKEGDSSISESSKLGEKESEETGEYFYITGVLVNKDGKPISNETVYYFVITEGKVILTRTQKGGFLEPDHPGGETDSSGNFKIKIDPKLVEGKKFTVGLVNLSGAQPLRVDQNGAILAFEQVKSPLNLGKITVEKFR